MSDTDKAFHRAAVEAGYAPLPDYVAQNPTPPFPAKPDASAAFEAMVEKAARAASIYYFFNDSHWKSYRGRLRAVFYAIGLAPGKVIVDEGLVEALRRMLIRREPTITEYLSGREALADFDRERRS